MSRINKEIKDDDQMPQLEYPSLPQPTCHNNRLVQAEVDSDLLDTVKKTAKKEKVKIRQVIEYGLKAWLRDLTISKK